MSSQNPDPTLVVIPYTELSEKTLQRLLESFVLREGTEYGSREFSLDEKVGHVLNQLKRGEVGITFDSKEETFDIRRMHRL